jgi:hypothetical protein
MSLSGPELLSVIHSFPFYVIGVLGAVGIVITGVFRLLGDAVEGYYDFRRRCASARAQYLKSNVDSFASSSPLIGAEKASFPRIGNEA